MRNHALGKKPMEAIPGSYQATLTGHNSWWGGNHSQSHQPNMGKGTVS